MKVVLTDSRLKTLQPAPTGKRIRIWDAHTPSLAASITDKGKVSFVVIRRRKGDKKLSFVTLGKYPALTLKDARERVPTVLQQLERGEKPTEVERAKRRAEEERLGNTFSMVAEDFFKRHLATKRTGKNFESLIRRQLLGQKRKQGEKGAWVNDLSASKCWRDRPITEITRRDVISVVERQIDAGHRTQAKQLLAMIRLLFNWAISRDCYGLEVSPAGAVKSDKIIGKLSARDRVLDDDELRYVWRAAGKLEFPFGTLTRMLMLTACRVSEMSDARWSEIDMNKALFTIPAERYKIGQTHTVPLSPTACALLEVTPRFKGEFVFTSTAGNRPVSGFGPAKRQLDREIARLRAADGLSTGMPHFVFHDLRRTVRTRLSSLVTRDVVSELVIGHRQKGIHAVYDLHKYDAEKRAALVAWEETLMAIVEPKQADQTPPIDNVVHLRR